MELFVVILMVLGAKYAVDRASAAAASAGGRLFESVKQRVAEHPIGSQLGEWGPKVAAGAATATYGTPLMVRAFFRDWRANWRAGREEALRRYGRDPETETPAETVSANTAVPVSPPPDAPTETPRRDEDETRAETTPPPGDRDPDYVVDFRKNLDEATERFETSIARDSETETRRPSALDDDPVRPLTEEEDIVLATLMSLEPDPDEQIRLYNAAFDPEHWRKARIEQYERWREGRQAAVEEYHRRREEAGMEVTAEGQGSPHLYVVPDQSTATEPATSGDTRGQSMTTIRLETFETEVTDLGAYVSTEAENIKAQAASVQEVQNKLESLASGLAGANAPKLQQLVQQAREHIKAAQDNIDANVAHFDAAKAAVSSLEDHRDEHRRIREAHQAADDSEVDTSFYS
jgi:hypothetical protein